MRWLRRALAVLAGLVLLGAAAVLALPSWIKSQAESRGSQALGRTLTIGAVDFTPWTLTLALSDIRIARADGKAAQLSIARLEVDAALDSLWKLAPVVDAITITQPHISLAHAGDGRLDVDDLLARFKPDPQAAPSQPVQFALHNLVLHEGSVDFSDQVGGAERKHSLRKLEISLPFISNMEAQRAVTVQPRLAFELNGSAFDTAASATPFAAQPQGKAQVAIQRLDIAPYLPYLPSSLPVRVKSGVLDGQLTLEFAQGAQQQLVVSGTLGVSDLRVDDTAGASLLKLASVQADIQALRPLEQSLALASVRLQAPELALVRNAAGALVLPGMQAQSQSTPVAAAKDQAAEAKPWQFSLDALELKDGVLRVRDDSVAPAAQFVVDAVQVALQDVQWPMQKPAQWDASAQLRAVLAGKAQGKPAALQLKGEGTAEAGTARAQWSGVALSLAAPYIRPYVVPQVQGQLQGELQAEWKGSDVQLRLPRVAVQDAALLPPVGSDSRAMRGLPSWKLLEVRDAAIDLAHHSASVGALTWRSPKVRVARGEDGQWMFSQWLPPAAPQAKPAPAKTPAAASTSPAQPPAAQVAWSLKFNTVALDDATVTWVDRVPAKPVFVELSSLQARMTNLVPDGKKPVPLSLSAKVRGARSDAGSLRFDGKLMWDPVLVQGAVQATQLPVQAVAPYALRALRLDLLRADTSFKGQVRYASLPAGPDVQVQGDAAVEELQLNSFNGDGAPEPKPPAKDAALVAVDAGAADADRTVPSEELLSWKALSVPGIALTLSPGQPLRLSVREVSLADFYARLIVSPEGRLVLQDIVRPEDIGPPATADGTAPAPAETVASTEPPAQIDMGPIKLVNGRVAFSDRFIKPNYSASLTGLSGSLSSFSSQSPQGGVQMADLELRGRAEGTASLEITGKVNPLAKPLALDIQGKVRDLELSPLSSYAIKYAGYGIERGKLSVDVQYNVAPDGQLQASNKLVLNQLVFGDEVQGAANRLPVKLAVALLADRNGVIDLDLPLSGSLNDPQFRVWPIVWKIVGNIVAKALTAPFNLLTGLFSGDSGADSAQTVAFEPGSTRMSDAGQKSLDQVARALLDKPALRLTVVGSANLEREADAIRRERLAALLLAEKRRQAATAGQDVTSVAQVSADETPALLKEVYRRSSIKKPRNMLGLSKDLPAADMESLLLESMVVNEDTVRELALNRSVAVRDYLTARQLPSDRLFLGSSKITADANWQPRAELELERH